MAGYSATPLWKKLGYKTGMTAYVARAPDSYVGRLRLPAEVSVTWVKDAAAAGIDFVHLFTASRADLSARLQSLRHSIAPSGMVWISWPKKTSGVPSEITEDLVREVALPLGFVDIKVCAVDEIW